MAKIATENLPGTMGNVVKVIAGLMASHVFLNPLSPSGIDYERRAPFVDYTLAPSTYGEYANQFAAARLAAISALRLETVYADLMAKQERLGREFEEVLFANLWTLYSR